MKNTLWTFGDSFIHYYDNCWVSDLAKALDLESKAFGKSGSSLDYTYFAVNQNIDKIKENDIVIITLTHFERQWLIEDSPEIGSLIHYEKHLDKEKLKFIYNYFVNNLNIDLLEVRLENFLFWLSVKTSHLKIKPIIFSCFKDVDLFLKKLKNQVNLEIVDGFLQEVSRREFSNIDLGDHFELNEFRQNHLSLENHKILENKIFNFIKHNQKIDLLNFKINIL